MGYEVLKIQENDELTPVKVINTSSMNMQGTFHSFLELQLIC